MLGSFSFRDCLQDGHSQTIVPDPLFSSVPFPLLPQLGVNSRYHLPKIGCRPQDKAPFFQSGKYQVWTLKSLGRWSNICEFTCINNPFISGQKVHCIAFLSPLRNKKKEAYGWRQALSCSKQMIFSFTAISLYYVGSRKSVYSKP